MTVYVTGDTHGTADLGKLRPRRFEAGNRLTKDDYVIVAGDFGLVWDGSDSERDTREWLDARPWTTLFVDGNHENHELLASLPVEKWHGGLVHRVSGSILHLMRGQVFDLDGLSVFAMGGAESVDRQWRVPYRSWWPEEIPNADERSLAEANLAARNWSVDYVVTHEAPYRVLDLMYGDDQIESDDFPRWLDGIAACLSFDVWYFGHHHIDENHGEYQACFEGVYPLGETEPLPVVDSWLPRKR